MRGSMIKAGTPVLTAGRRLRPSDLAQIAALGITQALVWRCPRVGLVIAGPKAQAADGLGPMLRALIVRDGGIPEGGIAPEGSGVSLQAAIAAAAEADIIVVAGRSGAGEDDVAAISLAAAGGTLEMHGMAMRPGSSSGLGILGTVPVILLPGDPPACLSAYDLLASRLIRRIAGFSRQPPYRIVTLPLRRKIVSAVGFTDIVPVAVSADGVTPIGSVDRINLAAACRAAGFVVVPETLEGHPAGEIVSIHLYDPV